LLLHIFYFKLGWAPPPLGQFSAFMVPPPHVTGFYLIDSLLAGEIPTFLDSVRQIALPALSLALFAVAPIARATRAAMLDALASDFVRTARAIPLGRFRTTVIYAFGNALLPVLTNIGMVFSFLLGANVLVEKVFAWPGIGSYAINALIAADYAPVQGFVLVMAVLYIALNLAIDLAVIAADPRAAATCPASPQVRRQCGFPRAADRSFFLPSSPSPRSRGRGWLLTTRSPPASPRRCSRPRSATGSARMLSGATS
jgi:peptide/nickel transport system permease protein